MLDGWVPTFHGYGHSAEAVFEYDTPWHVDAHGENKTYWQKQPGTLGDKINITWRDGAGHVYSASGDLIQDQLVTLSAKGVAITAAQSGQASLPSLSLG
jgi:hypothetical protein